jgi:acyl-CoA hydrolase
LKVNACDPKSLNRRLTTHCIVIMVAVDQNGQSERVPEWIPKTAADKKEHDSAIKLMEMRKNIGEEMQIFVE